MNHLSVHIKVGDEQIGKENIWVKALLVMMPFSTGIGLARVGIIGLELELSLGRSVGSGHWIRLQK